MAKATELTRIQRLEKRMLRVESISGETNEMLNQVEQTFINLLYLAKLFTTRKSDDVHNRESTGLKDPEDRD